MKADSIEKSWARPAPAGACRTAPPQTIRPREAFRDIPAELLPPELFVETAVLGLGSRARRCLDRRGAARVGDVAVLTEAEVRAERRCGRGVVEEIGSALALLGLSLGMSIPAWRTLDPARALESRAAAVAVATARLREARYAVDSSRGFEREAATAIATVAGKRSNVNAVVTWLGFDQEAAPTLQLVGRRLGLTRAGVSYLIGAARGRLAAVGLEMPKLRAAVKLLEESRDLPDERARSLLVSARLSTGSSTINGLLRTADFFGVRTSLGDGRPPKPPSMRHSFRLAFRHAAARRGCAVLEDVAAILERQGGSAISLEEIRSCAREEPVLRWLDEPSGWFWMEDDTSDALRRRVDKVLAVVDRIELPALRIALGRRRFKLPFTIPSPVVLALCRQLANCRVVDGRVLVADSPRRPEAVLCPTERTLLRVFRAHGPCLSGVEARWRCVAAGIGATKAREHLDDSPIIRRILPGVYALVGSNPTGEAVADAAAAHRRGSARSVARWCERQQTGETVRIVVQITESIIQQGAIGLPAGTRGKLPRGERELRSDDGVRVFRAEVGASRLRGLGPLLRQRGAEPGDYLRLTFAGEAGDARAELSPESFHE